MSNKLKMHFNEMNKNQRIGIVFPAPYFDAVPSLCNAAIMLARHGYFIEIYTVTKPGFLPPQFNERNISVHVILKNDLIDHIFQSLQNSRYCNSLVFKGLTKLLRIVSDPIIQIENFWFEPMRIRKNHIIKNYCCFIGVDPSGLLLANTMIKLIKVPLVYYSLELLISDEIERKDLTALKMKEIEISRKSLLIITQDEQRARILSQENDLPFSRILAVPNGPLENARRKKNNYWYEKFSLPKDHKIVLYVGSLDSWNGVEEMIQSVSFWPEKWCLILHTFYNEKLFKGADFIERMQKINKNNRIFFSLTPVPSEEYASLIDGADIGIAFYYPNFIAGKPNKNIATMGLSSGKVAYYLRAGLPVIINNSTTLSRYIVDNKCGIAVSEPSEVGEALIRIGDNYQDYSINAMKFFDEKWEFSKYFSKAIDCIDKFN
jgi:glycosyltransferase involved in cell wall biosynthesis